MADNTRRNEDPMHRSKGSPESVPGQAVESGEPTITGMSQGRPLDKNGKPIDVDTKNQAPKEGEHWESGRQHAQ